MTAQNADNEEKGVHHQMVDGRETPAEPGGVWQAGLWFSLFSSSSISMVLLNKFCATSFRQHFSLLGFQNSVTIILNLLLVKLGVFSMKPVDAVQFRMFLVPTMLFVGSLVTSLTALPLVSVSTTVIFRAMTTCGVAVGDILIFGKRFSVAELLCLVAVVIGAAVYAANDLAFNLMGYVWMVVNMLILVVSSLYGKHAIVSVEQTPVGISCVQNFLSLPIIIVFGAIVSHETPLETLETTGFWTRVAIALSGLMGCSMSVCSMSLGKFASATAISLTGNFNRVVSIALGAALFSDPLSLAQATGLAISMAAIYGFSKGGRVPGLHGRRGAMHLLALCVCASGVVSVLNAYRVDVRNVIVFGRRKDPP